MSHTPRAVATQGLSAPVLPLATATQGWVGGEEAILLAPLTLNAAGAVVVAGALAQPTDSKTTTVSGSATTVTVFPSDADSDEEPEEEPDYVGGGASHAVRRRADTWETDEDGRPVIVIDRGQPVIVTMTFGGDPDEICAAYVAPGDARPHTDDGYGSPRSRIVRLGELTDGSRRVQYRYKIDTTGFAAGHGWCHVWARGSVFSGGAGSEFMKFRVRGELLASWAAR